MADKKFSSSKPQAVYFEVMAEWFARLRLGTSGGVLHALVAEKLPFEKFGIFLNPGHLIHLDEWLSSPIYRGSTRDESTP
jgi:hypothetical protein